MKCPFSYFLTYGLKIREPIEYEFSQSRIGTLTHYILESIVNRHGKDYPHVLLTEIEALMDEQLHHMVQIYPTFQLQLPLLKQRLMNTIQYNLNYMKEMEAHAHIAPYACEHEFWWDIPTKQNITLCMHGFIDRIDASEGYIRIIDYKSSPKSLSLSDVQAGLQLQLLAYALYAKETFQKEVLGVYYYSFLIDTLSAAAGKIPPLLILFPLSWKLPFLPSYDKVKKQEVLLWLKLIPIKHKKKHAIVLTAGPFIKTQISWMMTAPTFLVCAKTKTATL